MRDIILDNAKLRLNNNLMRNIIKSYIDKSIEQLRHDLYILDLDQYVIILHGLKNQIDNTVPIALIKRLWSINDNKDLTLEEFIVCALILDLLNNIEVENSLINFILDKYPLQEKLKDDILSQYKKVRQSDYMIRQRNNYYDSKESFCNFINYGMLSHIDGCENLPKLQDITAWDEFCHFFSYILKAMFSFFGSEYKSTKDQKLEANEKIRNTPNNRDDLGLWQNFATDMENNCGMAFSLFED